MQALLAWVDRGEKPTAADVAARCAGVDPKFDPRAGCRFLPQYRPAPLSQRVPPRDRIAYR